MTQLFEYLLALDVFLLYHGGKKNVIWKMFKTKIEQKSEHTCSLTRRKINLSKPRGRMRCKIDLSYALPASLETRRRCRCILNKTLQRFTKKLLI